ncbi:dsDNA nuclease domain-containing protein [Vreelandella zhaodongensis]|uniref:DUF4297 domain-containing protein n=1 Tax=Vreelandella zhaodongensis TaxID=1176240 RepID=A0ABX2SPY8_VREZH|nr:dsDNA nuclease domain-containing protein [Halomonas zhaodongensis]NYS43438.1 DUF4297 domain-containing protein [Halomonas zhaodongensis]
MSNTLNAGLESTIAKGDPGDDTANRYRFQWIWAAVTCCRVLDNTLDVLEVFCEHHEDVLIKHRDGSFTGHQVKTRADNQPPWKASDDSVIAAYARFVNLDNEYSGKFRSFCFLTNHVIHSSKNGQDLPYVLSLIKVADSISKLEKSAVRWVKKVAKAACVSDEIAFNALSKCIASAKLPKLRDALMRLIDTITQCWPTAKELSHDTVVRSAQELVNECTKASSLDHLQLLPAYMAENGNDEDDIASVINGKRMTLSRIQNVLESGRNSYSELIGDPSKIVQPYSGSTELLHKKLDTGGFSIVTRNSADDLRDKADYLGIAWTKKHGENKGLDQYNHVLSLVLNDAGKAFDAKKNKSDDFGPAMRDELVRLLKDRRADNCQLYDATIDHLEGMAFSLTAQCKIAWSNSRPWESE